MAKIALLTDSSADLTEELIRKYDIHVVPLRITCADGEYSDGVDIHPEDIYVRLQQGELPKTSLPSPELFERAYEEIIEGGYDSVVAIILSGRLSGTSNLAEITGREYADRLNIRVFDSLSGSLGQAMILLQAAEDIAAGMDWTELTLRRIPFLIGNTYPFFTLDTLEYLKKGGRIGKVTAAAGTLLGIKPVLTFSKDGYLTSAAKVRGQKAAIDKLVELTVKSCAGHKRYNLAVANGGARSLMPQVREKLIAALPDGEHLWWGEIDSTLSVYIGDGVLGAAVQLLDED